LATAPCVDRAEYLAGMEWKREEHAEHGTTLVETYSYEKSEGMLLSALEEKLAPYVILNPISPQEILSQLESMGQFDDFTGTLGTFLRHFKGSGSTMEECRGKAKGTRNSRDGRRGLAFLEIFEPVYEEYQEQLGGHIDFDDMISRATDHVRESRYRSPYRHLLVDEFQDISRGRADLLIALRKQKPDCRIFAVGDDWQSIYRFSGSDIHLMRDFGRIFGGTFGNRKDIHQIVDLGRTFRSVDRIAHPARRFILGNPSQIEKEVIPAGTTPEPAIHILWSRRNRSDEALERALTQLQKQTEGRRATVLLVGRYNWQRPENLSRLGKRHPGLSLSFKSIHASKGLEADHVVILGADSGRLGLPSEIIDDPLLDLVLPEPEPYEHAEERRVFYVALTRARRSVTIIAREDQPSDFVNELLEDGEYGVAEMTEMGKAMHRRYRCARCEGHLVPDGKSRYSCEHRENCGASLPACPACGAGLPLRDEATSDTSECACGAAFPACSECPDGWLVERRGKYGRFLGCVNYPLCKGRKAG
ncbi:MAG: UvrD-helicase domain-containing protein, partial [Gammaproteobacteria bacterium]|nr:UvrD-helicase domain-containing protein [Gammaproteobacteria bacterium]